MMGGKVILGECETETFRVGRFRRVAAFEWKIQVFRTRQKVLKYYLQESESGVVEIAEIHGDTKSVR